jgi:hypothetical protein
MQLMEGPLRSFQVSSLFPCRRGIAGCMVVYPCTIQSLIRALHTRSKKTAG